MGIEFVEQPFPAEDLDAYRGLRELPERLPVIIDEGCKDLASSPRIATYADGSTSSSPRPAASARGCAWCTRRAPWALASCSAA